MNDFGSLVDPWTDGGEGGPVHRLVPSGNVFVDPTGHVVVRKGITAFALPKRFATGRGDDAKRYLDWVAGEGFTEVRPFSRVDWTGPPGAGVESGWQYDEAACEQAILEAQARGLGVFLTAHTGRFGNGAPDMAAHLQRVDELCSRHDGAITDVYNEPQQNGGHELVEAILRRYTPRTPGWSSGCYDPTPYTLTEVIGQTDDDPPRLIYGRVAGTHVGPASSYHSPRKDEWSRCFKDVIELQGGGGPHVVFRPVYLDPCYLDEPPQVEQTIRDQGRTGWSAVDDWEAYGAGSAFFGCGATMHSNPSFQRCEIPTDPTVLDCVRAFIRGFTHVPVQRYSGYSGALTPPSSNPGSRRYQRHGEDGGLYEITVRPFGFRRV